MKLDAWPAFAETRGRRTQDSLPPARCRSDCFMRMRLVGGPRSRLAEISRGPIVTLDASSRNTNRFPAVSTIARKHQIDAFSEQGCGKGRVRRDSAAGFSLLKLRVAAAYSPRLQAPRRLRRQLTYPVIDRRFDISLLTAVLYRQSRDLPFTVCAQYLDSRVPIDPVLKHAMPDRFGVGKVALLQPGDRDCNLGRAIGSIERHTRGRAIAPVARR